MKRGHLLVAGAGILSGTIIFGGAVFAKMGLSLYEISVFRGIFALLLFPYLVYKKDFLLSRKMLRVYLTFGLIVALGTILEFAPVVLGVPVAIVVLLLYTAPLWTVIFSKILFKESITGTKWIAIALVLTGIVVLVNPFGLKDGTNVIGLFTALLGGVFLSLWGVYGKVCGNEDASAIKTQFYETFFAQSILLIAYPVISLVLKDQALVGFSLVHSSDIWIYMLGFSLVSYIIPHFMYFTGIKEIPASTAGIILLLEPLSGAILAALFLSQAITLNVMLGGLLIVFANYLVIRAEGKQGVAIKESSI